MGEERHSVQYCVDFHELETIPWAVHLGGFTLAPNNLHFSLKQKPISEYCSSQKQC